MTQVPDEAYDADESTDDVDETLVGGPAPSYEDGATQDPEATQ